MDGSAVNKGGIKEMICPHCQKPVKDDQIYCPYCGKRVRDVEENKRDVTHKDASWKKRRLVLLRRASVILTVFLGICIIAFGMTSISKNEIPENKKVPGTAKEKAAQSAVSETAENESGESAPRPTVKEKKIEETSEIAESRPASESVTEGTRAAETEKNVSAATKEDHSTESAEAAEIAYEELLRNPEKYKGTELEYTGRVSGVGYFSDGRLSFYMNLNGYTEHIHFEMKDSAGLSARVLEEDELTVRGTFEEVETSWGFGGDYVKINVEELVNHTAVAYSETDITYERLLRYPEKYTGKKLEYTGRASGVGYFSDGRLSFYMNLNGYTEHIHFEMKNSSGLSARVLEEDELAVRGTFAGVETSFGFGGDYVLINVDELVNRTAVAYSETDITYERLLRYPEEYKGTELEYTGRVSGVGYRSDGSLSFYMNLNGYTEHIHFEMKDSSGLSQRVLEEDELTVRGTFAGVGSSFGFGGNYVEIDVTNVKWG